MIVGRGFRLRGYVSWGRLDFMVAVDLDSLSRPQKVELLEALWLDLTRDGDEVESPRWHGQVLADRVRLTESGSEQFVDWNGAKEKLLRELR